MARKPGCAGENDDTVFSIVHTTRILTGNMTKSQNRQSLAIFSDPPSPPELRGLLASVCLTSALVLATWVLSGGCSTIPASPNDDATNHPNAPETIDPTTESETDPEPTDAPPPPSAIEEPEESPTSPIIGIAPNITVSGSVFRGDDRTIASRRPITFKIRDANDQLIETFRTTNGQYEHALPVGFTGTITPIADNVVFDPPFQSFENAGTDIGDDHPPAFTAFLTFVVDRDGVGGTVGMARSTGTSGFPLASIQTATDQALPGDTVLIRRGTYTSPASDRFEVVPVLELKTSGRRGRPITIKAYENETVILDAENEHNECIRIRNQSHLHIEGLIAERSRGRNIRIEDSQYIEVVQCVARDNLLGNLPGFLLQGRCRYCVFDRCVSTRNGRGFLLSGRVETNDPTGEHRPRFCTVRNCLAYENTRDAEDSDGFQMLASSDNALIRCVAHDNGDDGFDLTRGSHRNVLVGCVAYNHPFDPNGDGDGNGFKIGVWGQAPPDSDGGGVDCVISRCISFGNKIGLNNNAIRLRIFNNVFFGNRRFGLVFDESTVATCRQSPSCHGEAIVRNNITSDNGDGDIIFNRARRNPVLNSDFNFIGDTTSTNDHNDESGHESASLFGRDVGGPGFVDSEAGMVVTDVLSAEFGLVPGFRPGANSIAIDRGRQVTLELLGPVSAEHPDYSDLVELITLRSALESAPVDMGAYEHQP